MNYDLTYIKTVAICDHLIQKFNHKRIKAENTKSNLEQSLREMHDFSKALPALLNIVLDVIGSYKNNLQLIPKGKDRDKVLNELYKYERKYSRLQKKGRKCSPEVLYEQQHQIKELITEMSECDEQLELLSDHRALLAEQEQNNNQATGVEFSSNLSISAPVSVLAPHTHTDPQPHTDFPAHTHADLHADHDSRTVSHTDLKPGSLPEALSGTPETPKQQTTRIDSLSLPVANAVPTNTPVNNNPAQTNPSEQVIQLPKLNSSSNPVSKTA